MFPKGEEKKIVRIIGGAFANIWWVFPPGFLANSRGDVLEPICVYQIIVLIHHNLSELSWVLFV